MFFRKKADQPRRMRPFKTEGLSAQPVFSYHARSARTEPGAKRSKLLWVNAAEKPASPRKPASSRSKRVVVVAGVILAVALVLNGLFLSRNPLVMPLAEAADGRQALLRSQSTYQQAAQAIFGSSLANTNKLTVDTARVAEEMRRQFPELEQVSVALPLFGRQPVIYIQPAKPVLLFRASNGGVFVLDSQGRAVMDASQVRRPDKLGLPVIEDQSGLPVTAGSTALPSSNIAFITEVVGQLKAKRLKPTSLTLPAGASQLDVRLEGIRYYVKFNLRGDARVEAGAFLAVKKHLERTKKTPGSYIDVRVENRAYYR